MTKLVKCFGPACHGIRANEDYLTPTLLHSVFSFAEDEDKAATAGSTGPQ
jgi:succinate dehydrogenase/fumarate reductase-like Fe-S protein